MTKIMIDEGYRPTDDEPFMNERQREYFRRKLIRWKGDILKEAQETLATLQSENENHPDLADRASSETDRAIELRARDRQRKLIAKIDSALARIDDGTYGYCEETGEPISLQAPRSPADRNPVARGAGAPRAQRARLSGRLTAMPLGQEWRRAPVGALLPLKGRGPGGDTGAAAKAAANDGERAQPSGRVVRWTDLRTAGRCPSPAGRSAAAARR